MVSLRLCTSRLSENKRREKQIDSRNIPVSHRTNLEVPSYGRLDDINSVQVVAMNANSHYNVITPWEDIES